MNELYDLDAIAERAVAALKAAGADKASCSVNYGEVREFNYEGGDFSLFRTLFNTTLSIMSIKGGKKGSARINSFDDDAIAAAIADCLATGEASEPDDAWDIAPVISNGSFTEGELEPDTERLFDRTRELVEDIGRMFPKIVIEQLVTCHSAFHNVYRNSNGVCFDTSGGYYICSPMYSAHEGERSSSFFYSECISHDLSKPFIETGSMKQDLADTEKQIVTRAVDGKFVGTVILTPGCLGELLGSALGNFAGDTHILDGTSIWLDKLGKQVASEALTVKMAVSDPRLAVSDHYTGEGFPAENYNIIENGVLREFDISYYVANKTGKRRAPNDGGKFVIEGGSKPLADMIASIDRGLLVARFSGGEPSSNGDFSGVAKNSFIIENGKITDAAAETMISGNLADMLMNIVDISAETVCDGSSLMPYISFGGITVSGK
ncbi:MAG: metallopeptidase TldD-related protein [Eubacteriales bacterium]|nr:metallopeptidase TldD-related protein [Eubacteriales bacterium]